MKQLSRTIRPPRWTGGLLWLAAACISAMPGAAHAQADSGTTASTQPAAAIDAATAERLIKRLDAQEAEIRELRARLATQPAPAPAAAPTTGPSTSELKTQLDQQQSTVTELKSKVDDVMSQEQQAAAAKDTFPTLQFHAFADIDYHASNNKADHNTFTLAEFDLFLQSQIAEQWSVLTETVLSADNTNTYGVEVERLIAQYRGSDFFNVDVGRFHTAIGYYNTAYHHGTWFQTAENRPFFLQFEDSGGIIAAHMVGISVHGAVPSCGALGLSYFAEMGNGRQWVAPTSPDNAVGNVMDDNDYKAFNFALISRPDAIPGLQLGAGVYLDRDTPVDIARTDETMVHSHVVYRNADWEFLAEGLLIDHKPTGSPTLWSYAYYAQISRKFGKLTPYLRYSCLNANNADPLYQVGQYNGLHFGPSIGCRYDLSDFIALKLEYDYFVNKGPATQIDYGFAPVRSGSYSEITAQLAFTF